jgi:hypothetical protein
MIQCVARYLPTLRIVHSMCSRDNRSSDDRERVDRIREKDRSASQGPFIEGGKFHENHRGNS